MTQEMGPELSKRFMDMHERSDPNPWSETAMDLWNNAVGRSLAMDPKNADEIQPLSSRRRLTTAW